MNTLIIIVSIGKRSNFTDYSMPRASYWASKHGYNLVMIKESIQPQNRSPHYAKLAAPKLFPNYDRYCIIDDDLLLSKFAPPLPEVPIGKIGLARDEVQVGGHDHNYSVNYNTGFIIINHSDISLLAKAIEHGDEIKLPGPYDQGALNYILQKNQSIYEIDMKWNFQFINHFIVNYSSWDNFDNSFLNRLIYFFSIGVNLFSPHRKMIKNSFGLHLIKCRHIKFINYLLP